MFGFKSRTSKQIGDEAEKLACDYLTRQGLTLVERNYQIKGGEIDLVMRDDQHLVFIEVRCRNNRRFGSGAESVDARKQARLIKAATTYLQQHSAQTLQPARFDVMSISTAQPQTESSSEPQPEIEWIKDAFQA
ncbi:MAG: YraN family protein [Thioalkalispiraceae bacterium]|jgi:putative endonuclease